MSTSGGGWARLGSGAPAIQFKSHALPSSRSQGNLSAVDQRPTETPPSTSSDPLLDQLGTHLMRLFPSFDKSVVREILEATGGDIEQAEILLSDMLVEGAGFDRDAAYDDALSSRENSGKGAGVGPSPAAVGGSVEERALTLRKLAAKAHKSGRTALRAAGRVYSQKGSSLEAQNYNRQATEAFGTAEELDRQAAELIFANKNKDKDLTEIDLHGLHRLEALHYLEERLALVRQLLREGIAFPGASKAARSVGMCTLRIIVGKGRHSKDNEAVLARAVHNWLEESRLPVKALDGSFEVVVRC